MSRGLQSVIALAISDPNLEPVLLYEATWASGVVRLWNGLGDISWNGFTWTGVGDLGGVSEVTETTETRIEGITVELSGIPATNVSLALGQARHGLPATVYFGVRNPATDVITADVMFVGRMDAVSLVDSGEAATITVRYLSRLADMRKASGRRYTDEDLQAEYPGDRGLEFVVRSTEGVPQFGGGWRWPS